MVSPVWVSGSVLAYSLITKDLMFVLLKLVPNIYGCYMFFSGHLELHSPSREGQGRRGDGT